MYIEATLFTLAAWFLGLFADANIDFNPRGFLCLRLLLPIIVMGLCILKSIKEERRDSADKGRKEHEE